MNYSAQIVIDLPREEVLAKIEDPANFEHWQKGFISYKHLSGTPGKLEARSKLKYQMGKLEIEMIKTIEKKICPISFLPITKQKGYIMSKRIILKKLLQILHVGLVIMNSNFRDS